MQWYKNNIIYFKIFIEFPYQYTLIKICIVSESDIYFELYIYNEMLTHISLSMNLLIYTFVFSSKHMRLVFPVSKKI